MIEANSCYQSHSKTGEKSLAWELDYIHTTKIKSCTRLVGTEMLECPVLKKNLYHFFSCRIFDKPGPMSRVTRTGDREP